jgi:transposase-like protein
MIAPHDHFLGEKMDGMLSHLEELLKSKNIFVRNRKKMKTRSLGILLYHYGLSLRKCRTILSSFEDISHESIRKWYHKVDTIFTVGKTYREIVAVDETKLKINGKLYILWAAIDIKTYEVLGVWVTKGRASIEAYSFIKYVLNKCVNQPKILVDGGPWYIPALERLKVEWEHVTFGLRNPIEQWFFLLKHRIKLFYRNWPYNATVNSTQQWIDCFVSMYHFTRC